MRHIFRILLMIATFPACKARPEWLPKGNDSAVSNDGTGDAQEAETDEEAVSLPSASDQTVAKPPVIQQVDPSSPIEVAKRFAPVLVLAPQESYYPMDPEEFYKKPEAQRDEAFFRSSKQTFKQGKQARIVVNISDDKTLLQYWIFYAKNGCQGVRLAIGVPNGINNPLSGKDLIETKDKETTVEFCNLAIHEGDWENITLKLSRDLTRIESAYLSAHGHGRWLPTSVLQMKGARPLVYSAINSHAIFPSDVDFAADATFGAEQLEKVPSLQWFQVGDAIKSPISMQNDTSGGQGSVEFDMAKSLWMWSDVKNTDIGRYVGRWGKPVDGKTILPPPKATNAVTSAIFEKISDLIFAHVSALQGKSSGNAPPSPWIREGWKNFDCATCAGHPGLARMMAAGTNLGDAFDDVQKLKPRDDLKLKQIRITGTSRVTRLCTVIEGGGDNCHGGVSQGEQTLNLAAEDYLTRIDVALYESKGDRFVSAVRFTTKNGKVLQAGTWTNITVEQSAPAETQIVGFHGRADNEIRQLGIIVGTLH